VVPVKRLTVAKSRLHVPPEARARLALAFALDTIEALTGSSLDRVVVVTDDAHARTAVDARRWAREVRVVPDVPDAGLNTALTHGAHVARLLDPECGILAVSGDLPALRATDIDEVLAASPLDAAAFVADASGTGTTMVCAPPGHELVALFGARSRAHHRAQGLIDLAVHAPSARRDVDTDVDLWDALRLGVGPATTDVLSSMPEMPGVTP
jgi:2-phospho-L-lactate guanylyltransferase